MSLKRKRWFSTSYVLGAAALLIAAGVAAGRVWIDLNHTTSNGFISGLVALTFLFATAQQGDILVLGAKKVPIQTNPLEPFLERNPGARPKPDAISTGNWRGYVATWQLKDDRIMLIDIEILGDSGCSDQNKSFLDRFKFRSVMSTIFPGRREVLADWFTGHVIIPDGELIEYVHMGYASTYERYMILKVEKGMLISRWAVDNAEFVQFRAAQFDQFKRTEEYRRALSEMRKGWTPEEKENFLRKIYSGKYSSLIFGDHE